MELSSIILVSSKKFLLVLITLLVLHPLFESRAFATIELANTRLHVNELSLVGAEGDSPVKLSNVALALPANAHLNTESAFRNAMRQIEGNDIELFKSLLEPEGAHAPAN